VQTGEAEVSMGLVHPDSGEAAVRFAVEEAEEDGWVPLGSVVVE
jgi:hypothetical protein